MNLYNYGLSAIRTAVPLAIGALVAWLTSKGITVDSSTSEALVSGIGFLVALGYYGLVRWGESKWSWLGWLLGAPVAPTYSRAARALATRGLLPQRRPGATLAPSIGRIVHYVSYGTPGGEYHSECRAAVVAEVTSDPNHPDQVALAVLNPTGMFFNRAVPRSDDPAAGGTWHWPERV